MIGVRKGTVFAWFVVSFLAMLLLPMLVSTVAFRHSIQIVEREIVRAHDASLNQLKHIMDGRLRSLQQLAVEIGWRDRVVTLSALKTPLDPYHRFTIYRTIADLQVYGTAAGFVDQLYLYFRYNDFILTTTGMYKPLDFYRFFHDTKSSTFAQWSALLKAAHSAQYVPMQRTLESGVVVDSIALLQTVPVDNQEAHSATLVLLMDESRIREAIRTLEWVEESQLLVIDGHDTVLFARNESEIDSRVMDYAGRSTSGDIGVFVRNADSVVSSVASDINDWTYVSVLPTEIFLEGARSVRRVVLLCSLVGVVLGVVAAILLARLNYTPISELIRPIRNAVTDSSSSNEYELLRNGIETILNENRFVTERLERQKAVMRESFLRRLVRGTTSEGFPIYEAADAYELDLNRDRLAIAVFVIDGAHASVAERAKGLKLPSGADEIAWMIERHLRRRLDDMGVHVVDLGDVLSALLSMNSDFDCENRERVYAALLAATAMTTEMTGMRYAAAVSRAHTSLDGLPVAYEEALAAAEYRYVTGCDKVFFHSDMPIPSDVPILPEDSVTLEHQLLNCIRASDFDCARSLVAQFFREQMQISQMTVDIIRVRAFGLISTIAVAVQERLAETDYARFDTLVPLTSLVHATSIADLQEQIEAIIDTVEKDVGDPALHRKHDVVGRTCDYIERHFDDVNLSVSLIADDLGVSSTHLSRVFKEATGNGVLERIHRVRISHAKEHLRDASLSVKEISLRVGYSNDLSFIRAFKRYEGVTPGRFRAV